MLKLVSRRKIDLAGEIRTTGGAGCSTCPSRSPTPLAPCAPDWRAYPAWPA
ncbi:hypothetical protein [Massilia glaciei]|uniref:hypothetical protein n=1 Tax=Massilia glaciei TaxID=1524097 RepID=UPI0015E7F202|nr:hypothetical protein [Massilia glaciei]